MFFDLVPKTVGVVQLAFKLPHCLAGSMEQAEHFLVTLRDVGLTARIDFPEALMQGVHHLLQTLWVGQQIILYIGVAFYDPDIPDNLKKHISRPPRAAL